MRGETRKSLKLPPKQRHEYNENVQIAYELEHAQNWNFAVMTQVRVSSNYPPRCGLRVGHILSALCKRQLRLPQPQPDLDLHAAQPCERNFTVVFTMTKTR